VGCRQLYDFSLQGVGQGALAYYETVGARLDNVCEGTIQLASGFHLDGADLQTQLLGDALGFSP
jgi:hypothetical protein